jgi:hypothetical protein
VHLQWTLNSIVFFSLPLHQKALAATLFTEGRERPQRRPAWLSGERAGVGRGALVHLRSGPNCSICGSLPSTNPKMRSDLKHQLEGCF